MLTALSPVIFSGKPATPGTIVFSNRATAGDMQSGVDRRILAGDMQSGGDARKTQETV